MQKDSDGFYHFIDIGEIGSKLNLKTEYKFKEIEGTDNFEVYEFNHMSEKPDWYKLITLIKQDGTPNIHLNSFLKAKERYEINKLRIERGIDIPRRELVTGRSIVNFYLDNEVKQIIKEQGLNLSEYIRRTIHADLRARGLL